MSAIQNEFKDWIQYFSDDFLLEDAKSYRYLSHGSMPVNGVDDVAEFNQTSESMLVMGLSPEDVNGNCCFIVIGILIIKYYEILIPNT